jgi:hypothetical protein
MWKNKSYRTTGYTHAKFHKKKHGELNQVQLNQKVADKTYLLCSCPTFLRVWDANYWMVFVGDLWFGFGYGNPMFAVMPWYYAKKVQHDLYDRIVNGANMTTLGLTDFVGNGTAGQVIFYLSERRHVVSLLDWGRVMTSSDDHRRGLTLKISQVLNEEITPYAATEGNIIGYSTRVGIPDPSGQDITMDSWILPFNVWWLKHLGARNDKLTLSAMRDGWNVHSQNVGYDPYLTTLPSVNP